MTGGAIQLMCIYVFSKIKGIREVKLLSYHKGQLVTEAPN